MIEKDYYVTMILRGLAKRFDFLVFKGGTSLSKCYRAIKRFSEDIDITIDSTISSGQRRKVQHAIADIARELWMEIPDYDSLEGRDDYVRYHLQYESVLGQRTATISPEVMMETSYMEISFPVEILPVHSYIGDLFEEEAPELLEEYGLEPFEMKVQAKERSLIDKVFAVCDYYMQGRVKKYSRHLYDIHKLTQLVPQDEKFRLLIMAVRTERAKEKKCLSAQPGVDVPELLRQIVDKNVYKEDYNTLTLNLLEESDKMEYEKIIQTLKQIAESGMFVETDNAGRK